MEYEFDVYEQDEMTKFLLNRHLEGRRESRMYEESEPECECYFSGDQADASACGLHGTFRKPMGRADSIVWDIRVEPIPASPGYYAWVPEHEERFGVAHGDTPETAIAGMREWIEFKTEVA